MSNLLELQGSNGDNAEQLFKSAQQVKDLQTQMMQAVAAAKAQVEPQLRTYPYTQRWSLENMIAMRLHLKEGVVFPFHLHAHRSNDTVFVFLVHNGKPLILEDAWSMFPSDQLISNLRLLYG